MAARNYRFIYDDVEVTRTSKLYKVILDYEEYTICLNEDTVNPIAEVANVDENLIAILLAYIDYVRRSRAKDVGNPPRKIDYEIVADGLVYLLKTIPIEELIMRFKSMKWHEVKEVLNSKNPAEALDEL